MAELTELEEKLAEVYGLAQAAQGATTKVAGRGTPGVTPGIGGVVFHVLPGAASPAVTLLGAAVGEVQV